MSFTVSPRRTKCYVTLILKNIGIFLSAPVQLHYYTYCVTIVIVSFSNFVLLKKFLFDFCRGIIFLRKALFHRKFLST